MAETSEQKDKVSILGIWKDVVSLLRDSALLLLGLLLVVFPARFNDLLVSAGFEEGSVVGFKWKAKLVESDQALKEAQATITDLSAQNEKLSKELVAAQSQSTNPAEKARLGKLEEETRQLKVISAKVTANVRGTIAANANLVDKALASSADASWGVVYGGDTNLDAARFEARKFGAGKVTIYLRQGSYRSVLVAADRSDAAQWLSKARSLRSDAYVVNLTSWCPGATPQAGYVECSAP